jgi:hypothetical protein
MLNCYTPENINVQRIYIYIDNDDVDDDAADDDDPHVQDL